MSPGLDLVTGHHVAAGMLLLAGPKLTEPAFEGSVILLLDHDGEGALGVILNRPTEAVLGQALPQPVLEGFGPAADAIRSTPLLEGGPVDSSQMLALVRWQPQWSDQDERLRRVLPGMGLADLLGIAASGEGAADPAWRDVEVRAYVGYAGWGPGQLEREVEDEAWYVLPADPGDPFGPGLSDLWRRVVARQAGRLSWLGLRPIDPGQN